MITKTEKKHILKEFKKKIEEWSEKEGYSLSPSWHGGLFDGYGVLEEVLEEMKEKK